MQQPEKDIRLIGLLTRLLPLPASRWQEIRLFLPRGNHYPGNVDRQLRKVALRRYKCTEKRLAFVSDPTTIAYDTVLAATKVEKIIIRPLRTIEGVACGNRITILQAKYLHESFRHTTRLILSSTSETCATNSRTCIVFKRLRHRRCWPPAQPIKGCAIGSYRVIFN